MSDEDTLRETIENAAEGMADDVSTIEPTEPQEVQPELEPLSPPEHWKSEDKELFGKHPREVQDWILRKYKDMESAHTKRSQELAGVRRMKEQLDELLGPYRDKFTLAGMDDIGAIRQLIGTYDYLGRNPSEAIQWLAQSYGVDLQNLTAGAQQMDPTVKALQQKIAQLEGQFSSQMTAQQKREYESTLANIQRFADAKDPQGKPLHPYFDEVVDDINAYVTRGMALEEAYSRAIYANPEVRTKVLAEQETARRAKEEADRKAKAEAARRASSTNVRGSGGLGTPQIKGDNLRADLEANYDKLEGRV